MRSLPLTQSVTGVPIAPPMPPDLCNQFDAFAATAVRRGSVRQGPSAIPARHFGPNSERQSGAIPKTLHLSISLANRERAGDCSVISSASQGLRGCKLHPKLQISSAMETAVDHNMEPSEPKKQVRWGTVSVLEFRVGYNASTVPESGGPPVGLVGRPTRHSYSMILGEDDWEASDSECESVESDSDSDTEMTMAPLSTGSGRRSRNDLWLDPMERARILVEDHAFPMGDIALICRDVRATLDSRAFSQLDAVDEKSVRVEPDVQPFQCGGLCSSTREKVLLY
ncbi:hypothetical protein DVH05_000964 [Phytophthora capsici]|nr:hypothetical protein DVH05_000964 [Phytophthora capsici]